MKRTDYISWDEYFMGVALLASMRSKDPNTQVGACIVDGSFDQLERVFSRTKDKARIKFMTANDEFISVHLNFLFVKLLDRTRSG